MTLQDNTSSINCMLQLQLNLPSSRLQQLAATKPLWPWHQPWSSEFIEFSHSATVRQRDLQPEHHFKKSIASLQGNWSTKLLYYLCSVSAWDEKYIRTGTANNGRHFGKMESSFSPRDRSFAQVEIICQIVCKFTQQRLGLITFEKSKLEFTIKFQCWKCRSTPQFRNEFGIPFHLAFRNKMAKISSSQRHSRHLAAVGQLEFSYLLTEPKDSSTITTFDCTERNQGWMDCRTLGDIQNSMKFYSTIGHENSFKIVGVLSSDI